jgi:hypothetical protein
MMLMWMIDGKDTKSFYLRISHFTSKDKKIMLRP